MLPGMGLCQENFICLESDRGEGEKKKKVWKFQRKVGFVLVTVSVFTQLSHGSKLGSLKNSVKCFPPLKNLEPDPKSAGCAM